MKTRVVSIRLGVEKVEILDQLAQRNNLNRNQMVSLLIDSAIHRAQVLDDRQNVMGLTPITRHDAP